MTDIAKKIEQRAKRHHRIRKRVIGSESIPRLVIFRSNKYIYAQIVDDSKSKTLLSESTLSGKDGKKPPEKIKMDSAFLAGEKLAKSAIDKKINKVVFDRSGYRYHGRVKALAEGARKGGLVF